MFDSFVKSTNKYCELEKYISAPYFRERFYILKEVKSAVIYITGLGFYEAHINGVDITKGILAPYISNPEHYVYYDEYDIKNKLYIGENVLGIILGNGFQNSFGGYIWDFDKASWRSAPILSFKIEIEFIDGEKNIIEPSTNTKTISSPIVFDDLHHGEYYDARLEICGWDQIGFDDSNWNDAIIADVPKGEQKICESDPIIEVTRINPILVTKYDDGYIYDFGVNFAGLCELKIKNTKPGQKIQMRYFETLKKGIPFFDNITFKNDERTRDYQQNIYICKGSEEECHLPHFTYFGFKYVYITGVDDEQATSNLLTFIVFSSVKSLNATFKCNNEIINKLQEATVRSNISNLYHFPTDCPHREKNGWTADASLSAEQMLINLNPENCYKEWLRNIYKAMTDEGQIPGIVPTAGWGYEWGNGPAWDIVMVDLPYYTYLYRGDIQIIKESVEPIIKYLHYLESKLDDNDLIEIGLGDWCEPDKNEWEYQTPLIVTDSIISIDIARKSAFIFEVLCKKDYFSFAKKLENKLVNAVKKNLIDHKSKIVYGETQTAQALGLYHGLFESDEYTEAFNILLKMIREKNNHCYCGVVGARVFYDLLAENGCADLAFDIITKTDFPSYGNWIKRGATTLYETFRREDDVINSLNHHFWGFISAWFYKYIAGIRVNPTKNNPNDIEIKPQLFSKISMCEASYYTLNGKVDIKYIRKDDKVILTYNAPKKTNIILTISEKMSFEKEDNKVIIYLK